jgi:iron complex outermembrane receptor protein
MGCSELGGFASWSATPSPLCYFNITQFEKLVEESDTFQVYGEANFQLTDSLEYHVEGLFHYLDLPDIAAHPSDGPLVFPSLANGATQTSAPSASAYFVDGHNPGVANFLNSFKNTSGTTAYTPAQIASITNGGRAAIPLGTWRPFGNGGNPLTGAYDIQHNSTQFWRLTNELKGDLVGDIKWDVALTYNHIVDRKEINDIPVQYLQNALNGLGGTNCNGIRADLPNSTCQWFNPFSSAIASNYYSGAPNPYYVPGLANSNDLIASLYVPIWLQRVYQDTTLDVLFSGDTGINLAGGPIAFAAGLQGRYRTEDTTLDDYSNRAINPCATLGQTNCPTETGALAFLRPNTVTGANGSQTPYRDEARYFPAYAVFGEVKLPVLDNLDVQLSGRYEKFISDITEIDNDVFVPAMSVLWHPIDELRVRGSYGQTFSQVNPPSDNGQNFARNVAAVPGFGGFGTSTSAFDTYNYDNLGVKPMKGDYFDVGFVTQIGGFTGTVDWYQISIDDYTRTMTAGQVITAIAGNPFYNATLPGATAPAAVGVNNDWRINCASPLLQPQAGLGGRAYAELAGGVACDANSSLYGNVVTAGQPGVNGMANGRVNFYGGTDQTNSGTLTTSGIDLSARYLFDNVLGGQLTPSIEGTYVLSWDLDDFIIGGVKVANGYDGVGYVNGTAGGRLGQAIPQWRASFSVNYHLGDHNINIAARFIPSVKDEDTTRANPSNTTNANIGNAAGVVPTGAACVGPTTSPPVPTDAGTGAFGTSSGGTVGFCSAQNTAITAGNNKIESSFNIDLVYSIKLPAETTMYLSIFNLTDEDPSFWRGSSLSYGSGYGSPLGRNVKLAVSKKF